MHLICNSKHLFFIYMHEICGSEHKRITEILLVWVSSLSAMHTQAIRALMAPNSS